MNKSRNHALDYIRVVAIMAVVMIHASASFVKAEDTFVWGNIFDCLSRPAVPLFVMLSGALMLDEHRKIDTKKLYFKNALGLLGLLMLWSVIYALYKNDGPRFLLRVINGHYHLWYLYMIISLYILTPFLRCMVKKENVKLVQLFMFLALCTQFLKPILQILIGYLPSLRFLKLWMDQFYMNFFANYTLYYLLGWYVVHIGIKHKTLIYTLGIGALVTTMAYVHMTGDYKNGYTSMSVLILLYALAIFTFINQAQWQPRPWVLKLSKLSFGIYLIHPMILDQVHYYLPYQTNPGFYIGFSFILTFILSTLCCEFISKIPYLKKSIRM